MRQGTTVVASVLLLSLALAPCSARGKDEPLPDNRLGIRTAPLLLLSRRDVQADLQLSPTQVASAETVIRDLYVKASALKGATGEKVLAGRREIDEQQRHWIENQLSETQRVRIVQIDLQWEGPSALASRPAVAEMLELTPEQRDTIKKLVYDAARRRGQGEARGKVEAELTRQTLAALSESQKLRWKAMLGQPFTPQLAAQPDAAKTAK